MSQKEYVLAIDEGTTSTRAILFNRQGEICATAQMEFPQYYPHPGWVEQDGEEIWSAVQVVMNDVMQRAHASSEDVAAIGITNQRETALIWDKVTGRPIYHAIVWQSRQTADICAHVRESGHEPLVRDKTGLVVDAYFSASKLKWILDTVPGARERAARGDFLCGTIDTWLIWKLTGGAVHATDYTNASRTMLFNIRDLTWDEDLLALFDIPRVMLPTVKMSSEVYGTVQVPQRCSGVRISGVAGDQHAALFGQACFEPGMAKNTYGTGCFLVMNTGTTPIVSSHRLLTTIGYAIQGHIEYALEGSVFVAGAAMQWLRDGLQILANAGESEALAMSVKSTGGVYFVPAFVGLGAPYWDMDARGAIYGLTRGTTRAELVRAALESIAYQSRDVLLAMEEDAGVVLEKLRVDGGASANDWLMQFQADILGVPVECARVKETTALGAAYLAGLAVGFWETSDDVRQCAGVHRIFNPKLGEEERNHLYAGWKKAVSRTLSNV